jgi:hypothetical protein
MFDVAIGMDESGLNQVLGELFQRPGLRKDLFSGSQSANILGAAIQVDWSVEQAPTVHLSAPTPDQWKHAIKADGAVAAPTVNALTMHFPQFKITRKAASGPDQTATVALDVICTINIQSDNLIVSALAVSVDLSAASAFDQVLYKSVIIPRILNLVGTAFGVEHLPNVNFEGLQFGPIALTVGSGRVAGVANLAGKPTPPAPDPGTLPNAKFFLLLGRDALQQTAQKGAAGLVGHSATSSGSRGFGLGNASYNGSVRLDSVSVQVGGDPTVINAQVAIGAEASAGVSLLGGIPGQIVDGLKTGVNTVGDGLKTAGEAIGHAFHGY